MALKGNLCLSESGCHHYRVLNGNGGVGEGVPDERGGSGRINVLLNGEMTNVLLRQYLVSRNSLRGALVSEFTHGYNGIAEYHTVRTIDALGGRAVSNANCITDYGKIPENTCGSGEMTACGESENIYLFGVGVVLLGTLSDGLYSKSRLNKRGVILGIFLNGVVEKVAVHTLAEEISDDRFSLTGGELSVASAGANDNGRAGSADGSFIANVRCQRCLGIFFPKIEFLIKHNTKCPFFNIRA